MKAFIFSDEIYQFHAVMLKSVLLILTLLPASQGLLRVWQATEGSSQIMVGFFALSLLSALFTLCFYSALKASVLQIESLRGQIEQRMVRIYRLLPMLFLAAMLGYLSYQSV